MKFYTEKYTSHETKEIVERLPLSHAQKNTLHKIFTQPISCIYKDCFRHTESMAKILRSEIVILPGTTLSQEDERNMFQQLHYARYKMAQLRNILIQGKVWRINDVLTLLFLHEKQTEACDKIISANLGLVFTVAKYVDHSGADIADLVGEGNMALLRVIDCFDWTRGYKFSTYAWPAIRRSMWRTVKQRKRYNSLFSIPYDRSVERDNLIDRREEENLRDLIHDVRYILDCDLAQLSGKERSVIKMRFPLSEDGDSPLSLREIGRKLGLSKERIRQIQNNALIKIRIVAFQRLVSS
jgi:RNA polymerase sigma factor (sigma-70 family)